MLRGALLGAIAGAAVATLPGAAGMWTAVLGAIAGGFAGWRFAQVKLGFSLWSVALLAFFAPVVTMAVAPGADMAMHVALARGLREGVLSPAWPGVHATLYPRGFSAIVALLSPLGYARAGLLAAAIAYLVFWAGLTAVLEELRTPAARTVAAAAVLISRSPQAFFGWGGNPTALALGLALFGAAQNGPIAALFLAGAAAVHPMGALAGALTICTKRTKWTWGAGGLGLVIAALAVLGPSLSSRETQWIRDYAAHQEHAGIGVLGDPANVVTVAAAAWLLWKRQWRPVAWAAGAIAGLFLLFQFLPLAGLYPIRFAPVLLVPAAALWGRAGAARIPLLAPLAILGGLFIHMHGYQMAAPIATFADLDAIACVARTTAKTDVIDGAYGDATQWIPTLTSRAVTRPHQHVSLFDETDAALARLPKPTWRFLGENLRYPPDIGPPPQTPAVCDGKLYPLR